jgi:hypothetical protein
VPTEHEIKCYYWELHEASRRCGYVSADSFRGSNPFVRIVKYDGKRWVSPTDVLKIRTRLKDKRERGWKRHFKMRWVGRNVPPY